MSTSAPSSGARRLSTRLNHLKRLMDKETSGFIVSKANESFQQLYDTGRKPESILLRSGFVARSKPLSLIEGDRDRSSRAKPPAAALIRSRGIALRLELGLVFARQCSTKTGARILPILAPDAELGLVNLFATGTRRRPGTNYMPRREQMRAGQTQNALDLLAELDLVDLAVDEVDRSRFDAMWLNNEAGPAPGKDPVRYKLPTPAESVISIPIEFFTNGWIQVLTDSEIANWLAFRHRGQLFSPSSPPASGVVIDAATRLKTYDLTRDTWDTHITLDRFGLMTTVPGDVTSELTASGQRFRKEPHEFDLDDSVLAKDGHASVTAAVAALLDHVLEGDSS